MALARLVLSSTDRSMDVDPVESATSADEDNAASRDRHRARLNTRVAITVALLATFLGVCKVKDDNIVQAMQQAQADKLDHWNFYQARNIREEVAAATVTQLKLAAAGAPAPQQESYRAAIATYDAARRRSGEEERGAAPAGGGRSEDVRRAELPRRPVRSLRYADCARHLAAGADRADPQVVALQSGAGDHGRRRGDGARGAAWLASAPGCPVAAAVLTGTFELCRSNPWPIRTV